MNTTSDEPARTPGRQSSGRRNEAAVGAALVLAVVLLFFGVRYLEDRPVLGRTYELRTVFQNASGLKPGSNVTISGIKVGTVRSVELEPTTHQVHVVLEIRRPMQIPRGSTAEIGGIAALDDVHITIVPGPAGAELVGDGDVISGTVRPALVDRADSTLASADQTFDQARSMLTRTEDDLAVVLNHLGTASGETASFVQSEKARLHETVVGLHAAVTQLNHVIARLDYVAADGGDTLAVAMNRLSASMRRLDEAAASLERGSKDLELILSAANSGSGTLGRLAHDPSVYVRLNSAVGRLDSASARLTDILDDFKANPGRYLGTMKLIDIF